MQGRQSFSLSGTDDPLITVYIPTRDRPELLDRAVRSVLAQDYQRFEIIIVDDASAQKVVNIWSDDRIRVINNECPLGAPASRNLAIFSAQGEYITGLDDDDIFLPRRLSSFLGVWSELHPLFQICPIAALFDSIIVVRSNQASPIIRHTNKIVSYGEIRHMTIIGNQVFAPTYRLREVGGFDTSMPAWQDLELWHRMSRRFGAFYNICHSSMIIDESHSRPRVTLSSEQKIRTAFESFCLKAGFDTPRAISYPLVFALRYPSFRPGMSDVRILIAAGRYRQAFNVMKRLCRSWLCLFQQRGPTHSRSTRL